MVITQRLILIVLLWVSTLHFVWAEVSWNTLRKKMISEIQAMAQQTQTETDRKGFAEPVMKAMADIPRHEFVPAEQQALAYENRPLPIGYGQTISQPYIVALMTDLLDLKSTDVVLEIGTGCGYQTAVLAKLVKKVFTIEILDELGTQTKERLAKLGYTNVEGRISDGYYGWEEQAPFDAIIVTAAASHIPPPLVRQLKLGARMVIPIGERSQIQQLTIVEKNSEGVIETRQVLPVAFVPLTGKR